MGMAGGLLTCCCPRPTMVLIHSSRSVVVVHFVSEALSGRKW